MGGGRGAGVGARTWPENLMWALQPSTAAGWRIVTKLANARARKAQKRLKSARAHLAGQVSQYVGKLKTVAASGADVRSISCRASLHGMFRDLACPDRGMCSGLCAILIFSAPRCALSL
jgi:hypothetical protein